MYFIVYAISGICRVAVMAIVLEAIMSWFVPSMPDGMRRFYYGLGSLTEPLIMPFRGICRRFTYSWGVDFSPLLAILAIEIIERLLITILISF